MNRLLLFLALLIAGASQAQNFPSKPIRIIIPFTAGGTNDILARILGPKLSDALGQPVIVDNRPGGNTVIASQALLASDKDGHTLLLPGNSHVVVPHLTKAPLPFDSIRDFQPVADVMGGQAQLSFQTPATVLGNVKGGKLRALAISGATPFADPKVPTFAQAGLPGFDVELWFGLLAPGGTPRPIVERLNAEVNKIIQGADFREKVAAQGLEVWVSTPEQYGAALRAESEKFGRIVKAANIEPQ